jgi:hypothetical protein
LFLKQVQKFCTKNKRRDHSRNVFEKEKKIEIILSYFYDLRNTMGAIFVTGFVEYYLC